MPPAPGCAPRIEAGSRRARRTGVPVLVSISSELDADADPAAIVYASRAGDEPWFCFEQPDRERIALATLGAVRTLEATGPDRFDELAAAVACAGRRGDRRYAGRR